MTKLITLHQFFSDDNESFKTICLNTDIIAEIKEINNEDIIPPTIVYTIDGKTYLVKETIDEINKLINN